jgi:hypothetical protein
MCPRTIGTTIPGGAARRSAAPGARAAPHRADRAVDAAAEPSRACSLVTERIAAVDPAGEPRRAQLLSGRATRVDLGGVNASDSHGQAIDADRGAAAGVSCTFPS